MTIKHIVISGAAYNGIDLVGAITELSEKKYIERKNIESVFGSSAGAIVLAIWLLDVEKSVLYDFIIKRPWNKIYSFKAEMLFEFLNDKGLIDEKLIREIITPLLKSKDLSPDITLNKFFEFTKVKLTMYVTDFQKWRAITVDKNTHPDLKLVDALYMTSAMPMIFKPVFLDDKIYVDGAVTKHFPIKSALEDGCKKEETLGIKVYRPEEHAITKDATFFQYVGAMMNNMVGAIAYLENVEIPHCVIVNVPRMGSEIEGVLMDPDKRKTMLERGEQSARDFLESCVQELSD